MRNTLRRSPSLTSVPLPSLRLRFLSFDVRMWRRCECPRFTLPVAVFLKRLAAPLCVFNFGIVPQDQQPATSSQLPVFSFSIALESWRDLRPDSCTSIRRSATDAKPDSELPRLRLPPVASLCLLSPVL